MTRFIVIFLAFSLPLINNPFCFKGCPLKRAEWNESNLRSHLAFLLQLVLQLRGHLWNIILFKAFDDNGTYIRTEFLIGRQFDTEFIRKFAKTPDDLLRRAKSEMVVSSVSPERWEMTVR
jgi:hypothetical protein